MRTANFKHIKNDGVTGKFNSTKKSVGVRKSKKKFKPISFAVSLAIALACLNLPTTTLAPIVDAFDGDLDVFSTENTTVNNTLASVEITKPTQEKVKIEKNFLAKSTEKTQKVQKSDVNKTNQEKVKTTDPAEQNISQKNDSKKETEVIENSEPVVTVDNAVKTSSSYLLDIDKVDTSYSATKIELSEYDRAKTERLVMGEAGTLGYIGCALVAQSIRDAMVQSGSTSIDYIIENYQYVGSTEVEASNAAKAAVAYIFDENGSAIQHRVLCFYTGTSEWHETQNYLLSYGNVRFFDMYN